MDRLQVGKPYTINLKVLKKLLLKILSGRPARIVFEYLSPEHSAIVTTLIPMGQRVWLGIYLVRREVFSKVVDYTALTAGGDQTWRFVLRGCASRQTGMIRLPSDQPFSPIAQCQANIVYTGDTATIYFAFGDGAARLELPRDQLYMAEPFFTRNLWAACDKEDLVAYDIDEPILSDV